MDAVSLSIMESPQVTQDSIQCYCTFFTLCFALLHCLFSSCWCHPVQCYYTVWCHHTQSSGLDSTKLSKTWLWGRHQDPGFTCHHQEQNGQWLHRTGRPTSVARVTPHPIPKAVAGSVNFYGSVQADLVHQCPGSGHFCLTHGLWKCTGWPCASLSRFWSFLSYRWWP